MRIAAAAGLALSMAAGTAWADSYYVDASHSQIDIDGLKGTTGVTTVSGAYVMDMPGTMQIQIDGAFSDIEDVSDNSWGGTVHLASRSAGRMYGLFAGGQTFSGDDLWAGGVEGALYFRSFTLAGALAYMHDSDVAGAGVHLNGAALQTQARFFVTSKFRLDASFDYARVRALGGSADGTVFGAGGEYQLPNLPVSVFAAYTHLDVTDFDFKANNATIGLRFSLDKDLAERDEHGASLNSIPNFATLF